MQLAVLMIAGLVVGVGLSVALRKYPTAAAWIAMGLGVFADVFLVGSILTSVLPEMGRLTLAAVGLPAGVGTSVAAGSLIRGERKVLNWASLAVAGLPVLLLVVLGIAELVGPPH